MLKSAEFLTFFIADICVLGISLCLMYGALSFMTGLFRLILSLAFALFIGIWLVLKYYFSSLEIVKPILKTKKVRSKNADDQKEFEQKTLDALYEKCWFINFNLE